MAEPLFILQIEDSESDAGLIVRLLERAGHRVHSERVENARELHAALEKHEWHVLIADYHLPQFDAPAALEILRETGLDIPFIVVSGAIGEDSAVALMKAGAHDYLMKDNLARLVPAVEREIRDARIRRERRKAQQELKASEERLALAVQATQLGTFDYDPQSGKLIWSEFTRRQFGLAPDMEPSYELFLRALHPEDRDRVAALVAAAMQPEGGGQFAADYRAIGLSDGQERWISASGRVYFDPVNRPGRFVGVTIDITDRKRLEHQFRQAQKLESIGRLAGGVAHDFNNLLTVINGYSQMILGELEPGDMRDSVEEIAMAGARASELTRQLLAFSRRQISEPVKIAINHVLANFEKMLARLIGENVRLEISLDPDAGILEADPGQLEQVIMNLAVNAKDAMPSGGTLSIATSRWVVDEQYASMHLSIAPGLYVMLSVTDTGVGMSSEAKAHLFEPFFTTKDPGKGTGLGLSTVYGIVKQCSGSIWVYSEPGKGTTVKILFPAVEAGAPHALRESPGLLPGGNETILVAEDEHGVRKYVRQILESHGYAVLEAASGREAIQLARDHAGPIHLLLTDVVMPDLGGMELAGELLPVREHIPVLYMSGYTERLWQEPELAASFIQKPFTAAGLLAQVRTLLDAE